MINKYFKNIWIFLLSFTFLYADSSSALSNRMSLSLKDGGKLTVSTNYTTNALFRGIDPKTGREGGAILIEPATQVVKFDIDLIEHVEWDGFVPNVDWKFDVSAKKSKNKTSIDLSKYILPKNTKWDNMDISVRQGGIATLIANIKEYGISSNKSVDSLLLTGLDALKLFKLIGTTLGSAKALDIKGENGKITQTTIDKIKKIADRLNNKKAVLEDIALWAEYANFSLKLFDSLYDASLDEEVKKELEKEPVLIEFKRYSDNLKKISNDISKSLGTLGKLGDKLIKSDLEKQRDAYFEKLEPKSTGKKALKVFYTKTLEKYKKAKTKEEKSLILLNDLHSPAKDILGLYRKVLENRKSVAGTIQEVEKIQSKLNNLYWGEGLLYLTAIIYSGDDIIDTIKKDPKKTMEAVISIGQAVVLSVTEDWSNNILRKSTELTASVGKNTKLIAKIGKKGTTYIKAVTLGNDIANKMIPFIWDCAFAPRFLESSIVEGKLNPYGKMETEIKIYDSDTKKLLYTVSNASSKTFNPTIEVSDNDNITIVVGLKRPKMFNSKRSSWLVNGSFPARALYDATIIMPNKQYQEKVLCAMNTMISPKEELIYALHHFSGTEWKANPNMCGVNQSYMFTQGDDYGWYEEKGRGEELFRIFENKFNKKLPKYLELKEFHNSIDSNGDYIVGYFKYNISENDKDDIQIKIDSLDSNVITHHIHLKLKEKLDVDAGTDINTYQGLNDFSTISLKTTDLLVDSPDTKLESIVWKSGEKTLCTLNEEGKECLVKISDLELGETEFTLLVKDNAGKIGKDTIKVTLHDINADMDGDDTPDVWEINNGVSIYNQFIGIHANDSQIEDFDKDGVSDYLEYTNGTNPQDPTDYKNLVEETKIKKIGDKYILTVGIDLSKVSSSIMEDYKLALTFYNNKYSNNDGLKEKIYTLILNRRQSIYKLDVTSLLNEIDESMSCTLKIFYDTEKILDKREIVKLYYGYYDYSKKEAKFVDNGKLMGKNIKVEKFKKGKEDWVRIENSNSYAINLDIYYDKKSGLSLPHRTIVHMDSIPAGGVLALRMDNNFLDDKGKHNDVEFNFFPIVLDTKLFAHELDYTVNYDYKLKDANYFDIYNMSDFGEDGVLSVETPISINKNDLKLIRVYDKTAKEMLSSDSYKVQQSALTIFIGLDNPINKHIYQIIFDKDITSYDGKSKILEEYVFEREYVSKPLTIDGGEDQVVYETQTSINLPKPIISDDSIGVTSYIWGEGSKEYCFLSEAKECVIPNLDVGEHILTLIAELENGDSIFDEVKITVLSNIAKPTNLKQEKISNTKTKVSWDSVPNAEGYIVYTSEDGWYDKLIGEEGAGNNEYKVENLSFIELDTEIGKKLWVSVRAYKGSRYSPFSELLEIVTRTDTTLDDYPSTHTAETTTLSTSLDGNIETVEDIDAFKIVVEKSGTLTLYTTGSLDTKGVLYDSSGVKLADNDDEEEGIITNFKIMHSVTAGTYYLDVSAYDTNIGSYTVHKEFEENVVDETLYNTITGTVKDDSGSAVSGINVKFEYLVDGEEKSTVATTDSIGNYTIKVDKEFLKKDETYLIYAYKEGFVPSTKTLKITDSDSYSTDFVINPIKENEVVLEIEPKVHHLGDGSYSGNGNSQFQKKTEGTEFIKEFDISSTQYNNYAKAILKFDAKGIDERDKYVDNLIINNTIYRLEGSPSDGSYKSYTIQLEKSNYHEGSNSLKITSGLASSDYDDFEFSNIVLEFEGDVLINETVPQDKLESIYDIWTQIDATYSWIRGIFLYDDGMDAVADTYSIPRKDFYDISTFEKISGLKLTTNDDIDTECTIAEATCYGNASKKFLHINPTMVNWLADNFIVTKKDNETLYNQIQTYYDDKGKNFWWSFALAYKYLNEQKVLADEIKAYQNAVNNDTEMIDYLNSHYNNDINDFYLDNKQVVLPENLQMDNIRYSIGFWLRRGIDGSDEAVLNALKKFLEVYDSELLSVFNNNVNGKAFITRWKTDNNGKTNDNQIMIPTNYKYTYNYDIDWGDGTSDRGVTGDITHTYSKAGTYTVKIAGEFPHLYFTDYNINKDFSDSYKLLSVEKWGDIKWRDMSKMFSFCGNMVINAKDTPDLSKVTNMYWMFTNAESFNQDINNWDVSNITNMSYMFGNAKSFNQPLDNWNVSNVTKINSMFSGAESFNQDISNWDVSNVINMWAMFYGAENFNQPLNSWDVSNVTDMSSMFREAESFNQPLDKWNVSSVTNMDNIFSKATSFNQPLNSWDVSNVKNMNYMFEKAENFNQNISNWNTSNVNYMIRMFWDAKAFSNQDLSSWNVDKVTQYDDFGKGWGSANIEPNWE